MPNTTPDLQQIIEQAAQRGALAEGRISDLISAEGIALVGTNDPVILVVPLNPIRNVKYHRSTPPPHFIETPQDGQTLRFEGAEHNAIGDNILLSFPEQSPQLAANVQLGLPNGLKLTYGQVIALGGDFYGIPDKPISDGSTPQEREQRFKDAFSSLATAEGAVAEVPKIWEVMEEEIKSVNQALLDGRPASKVYEDLGDKLSAKWNTITGGGSLVSDFLPLGRYLKLAAKNWDHFGNHAVLAYQAGHAAALWQASKGVRYSEDRTLKLAYAMNAFADHFLTDLFSAGHLRTPRKELHDTVTPRDLGSYLSRTMHEEDCRWGLRVQNADRTGTPWRSYGDKRFFDTVDIDNKNLVEKAVQNSANEIYQAYTGHRVDPDNYSALKLIPDLQSLAELSQDRSCYHHHVSPLFVASGSTVLRRNDTNNLDDYSWTDNWWGWSTGKLLRSYGPKPPLFNLNPPTTSPSIASVQGWRTEEEARQNGRVVGPNWYMGNHVRYAVSFVSRNDVESDLGPWGEWVRVPSNSAFPTVDLNASSNDAWCRRIYRQFKGSPYSYLGTHDGSGGGQYIDYNP